MSQNNTERGDNPMTAPPAGALEACLALLTRMYNSGYAAGHNRTVEGGYVDVFYADRGDYHREEVEELLADDDYKPLATALRLREWRPIATCPTGEEVLLWNQETGDMFFGFKTLDAPTEDAIVTGFPHTAGYADAWMPKPDEPEAETADDLARILEEGE